MKRYNEFLWWVDCNDGGIKVYMNKYEPLSGIETHDLTDYVLRSQLLYCPLDKKNLRIRRNGRSINLIYKIVNISSSSSDRKEFDWVVKFSFDISKLKLYNIQRNELIDIILHNIDDFNKNIKSSENKILYYDIEKYFGTKFKIFEFDENCYTGVDIIELKLLERGIMCKFKYHYFTAYITNDKIYIHNNQDMNSKGIFIDIDSGEEIIMSSTSDFINSIVGED